MLHELLLVRQADTDGQASATTVGTRVWIGLSWLVQLHHSFIYIVPISDTRSAVAGSRAYSSRRVYSCSNAPVDVLLLFVFVFHLRNESSQELVHVRSSYWN